MYDASQAKYVLLLTKGKFMEQHLKDLLSEILYEYAYAEYNDSYSTNSYEFKKSQYVAMISVLISLAEKSSIDISYTEGEHCGWSYKASDFVNYEDLTKYW